MWLAVCCSFSHLMVRSGWGAEWTKGVFTWCGRCLVTQGRGLRCLSRGLWVGSRSLPLGGTCRNVPVVDTGHICDLLPSWRQVRVCLEGLFTPDIWWENHMFKWLIDCNRNNRMFYEYMYTCIEVTQLQSHMGQNAFSNSSASRLLDLC